MPLGKAAPETFDVDGHDIRVESRHTILVNRLCAMLGRRELRDFIDELIERLTRGARPEDRS